MGDLFDGYGSTLAPRKSVNGAPAFDEMFGSPAHPGALAESRDAYRELYQALARMTQEELRGRTDSLASSYLAQGVTFDFAGEERPFPLDAVPRIIDFDEWSEVEAGIKQRVRALEAFLDDAYGRQNCVRDGVIPAQLIASSQYFYRQAYGIHSANGVRIQVSGIDLIRDEHGKMRVLEDNVRVPSGVSYVISNRRVMAQTLPELFVSMRVRPVGDYPNKLLAALRASAPPGIDEPNVVVLTPGVYNSAYFEHTLLARLMGVELVEGRDLLCAGGKVFMRTAAEVADDVREGDVSRKGNPRSIRHHEQQRENTARFRAIERIVFFTRDLADVLARMYEQRSPLLRAAHRDELAAVIRATGAFVAAPVGSPDAPDLLAVAETGLDEYARLVPERLGPPRDAGAELTAIECLRRILDAARPFA
jgi:hypothetical protein